MCWDAVNTCARGAGVGSGRRARLTACCAELPRRAAPPSERLKEVRFLPSPWESECQILSDVGVNSDMTRSKQRRCSRGDTPSLPPTHHPSTLPMHLGVLQRSPCSRLAMSHKCRIRRHISLIRPLPPPPSISGPRGAYQADTTLIRRISKVPDISVIHQPDIRRVHGQTGVKPRVGIAPSMT